jgi:murein DD-endopeptidase MepM/ murein hydrolase activator NlpD
VTSPYGYRTHPIYGYWGLHDGTDFGGGCGKPLVAAANGRVLQSYWSDVYGNRLVVDHGPLGGTSLASIYNHATRYTVGVGARVQRGQVIGYMGSTGWSTGCHLHYTVMANGRTVDPMKYL